jgi:nitrate reductase NapE component
MRRTKTVGSISDFVSGEYKVKQKERRNNIVKKSAKVAAAAIIPLATGGAIGTFGLLATATTSVFASTSVPAMAPVAIEVGAKEWMGEQTLSALAHVLDPVVDVLVALSFPIASVIIVGACFFFMLGNSEKGWQTIQNAGLGYVLIQVSPLILNVLKQVGNAV